MIAARLPSRRLARLWLGSWRRLCLLIRPGLLMTARANIDAVLELTPRQGRKLAGRAVGQLLDSLHDTIRWNLRDQRLPLEIDPTELERLREAGGALLVCHHFGCFILAPRILADLGFRVSMVMHPTEVAWVDQAVMGPNSDTWFRRIETDLEPILIARRVQQTLNAGELLICSVDQSPGERISSMRVPFLGQQVPTATGAIALARENGRPVFTIWLERRAGALRVQLIGPDPPQEKSLAEAVGRQMFMLEQEIRRRPECWSWWLRNLSD